MTRIIIITGVSRGLGRGMTEQFIDQGCTVWGCARNLSAIEELQGKFGKPHHFSQLDVTDEAQVKGWSDMFFAQGLYPDLLINNAGLVNELKPLWEIEKQEFDAVIDVNIKGVANVLRHFVPKMVERGQGIIVNFSSGWGRSTSPNVAPYCATKWAIEGLTRSLSQELPAGMAAVPLNPGIIHTDMLEVCYGEDATQFTALKDWERKAVPFLLHIKPEDNGKPLTVPT